MTKPLSNPDRHYFPDEGCNAATIYLGEQSKCIDCPFEACVHEDGVLEMLIPAAFEELVKMEMGDGSSSSPKRETPKAPTSVGASLLA